MIMIVDFCCKHAKVGKTTQDMLNLISSLDIKEIIPINEYESFKCWPRWSNLITSLIHPCPHLRAHFFFLLLKCCDSRKQPKQFYRSIYETSIKYKTSDPWWDFHFHTKVNGRCDQTSHLFPPHGQKCLVQRVTESWFLSMLTKVAPNWTDLIRGVFFVVVADFKWFYFPPALNTFYPQLQHILKFRKRIFASCGQCCSY